MECDPRSSTGSTVSGGLNTIFKTKNPIEYIYISHPFGSLGSPQKQYNNNIKISPISSRKIEMSFGCAQYYRELQNRNQLQAEVMENTGNIGLENFVIPEFKYIIESIRKAWNSSYLPMKYKTLKRKNTPGHLENNQEDETIRTDLILQRSKQLNRRYSVPETAIRKYNFIYDHSCTKHANSIPHDKPMNVKNHIFLLSNKKLDYQNRMENIFTAVSFDDLSHNFDAPVEKPMPEVKKKKHCFYCISKKNNSVDKFEEKSKNRTDSSDNFISKVLIGNLKDDMIAEILMNNLNNDAGNSEKRVEDVKAKQKISSIYISAERLIGLVNANKDIKTYKSYKNINIIYDKPKNTNSKNSVADNASRNNFNVSLTKEQPPIICKRPKPIIISSTFSSANSSDNDKLLTSEKELLPVGMNKKYKNSVNSFCRHLTFPNLKNDNVVLNKRENIRIGNIQTNSKHQIVDSRNANNIKIPIIEEVIKTPYKNATSERNPSTISKSVLKSLEAYTFGSAGNINFGVLSAEISKQERPPIQSAYTAKYIQKKHPCEKNLRKITIFEAQSNMVTPDNENGPRRFYQKTEIVNGDKKIDILEIVECMQNPTDCEIKPMFNTKVSKIPVPIENLKFIRNPKNYFAKNMVERKLSKFEIREKQPDDKNYKENMHEMCTTYKKNNMPKVISALENVGKHTPKVNSKIQAVKPLRPFTNNIKNEATPLKNYQYSTTGAYLSTLTSDSLQNTITPSSGSAMYDSTSQNKNCSDEFYNKTALSSFRVNETPCLMAANKLHTISNLNPQNSLENSELATNEMSQYHLGNSKDFTRHNKLDAWRIPSSNFYEKKQTNMAIQTEFMPKIFPNTSNTESSINCKTICNKNCQLCSCCSTVRGNSQMIYSPTLSVCSLCSKVYSSTRLPSCNTECTLSENKVLIDPLLSCKHQDTFNCTKNCKIFPPIANSVCECISENSNISYLRNTERPSEICHYAKCSKLDHLIFAEETLPNIRLDFSAEGLVRSNTQANSKSSNEKLSCNWNANYNQAKSYNLTSKTSESLKKNAISKPVWTVTITTKCLEDAPELKMQFKFPQPPTELSIENNLDENEGNENLSLDSLSSTQKIINQTSSEKYSGKTYVGQNKDCYDDNDFGGYSLNLTSLATKRNAGNSKQDSKNLSVMGNAIAPEQKPRVQTMSERDLTRGRYHKTWNNF